MTVLAAAMLAPALLHGAALASTVTPTTASGTLPAAAPESASTALPPPVPFEIARAVVAVGPRVPGSDAHAAAAELLLEYMRRAGLDDVRRVTAAEGVVNLEGVLPGSDPGAGSIVLSAHYDTVAGSPGAADDAAGCAVVLAALGELRRAPLRRPVRVVFFDGEEAGLRGSRAWADAMTASEREQVLAALVLDVIGLARDGAGVALDLGGGAEPGPPRRAPAWLVHAALRAGAAVGFRLRVADHARPLRAQLLTRTARVPWSSDAASLLAAGIPALALTDFSALDPYDALHTEEDVLERLDPERLARWSVAVAAAVRRLDALGGRPRWEDEFLAVGSRVWVRRDLLWVGLALWIVLVLRGRPGRWAAALAEERRARGRAYLPGFAFRLFFLAAALWMPAVAAPLLYPLAPLALAAPRSIGRRALVAAAAAVPTLLWLGMLAAAGWVGLAAGWALAPARTALLLGTLGTFGWQLWSRPDVALVGPPADPAGPVAPPPGSPS